MRARTWAVPALLGVGLLGGAAAGGDGPDPAGLVPVAARADDGRATASAPPAAAVGAPRAAAARASHPLDGGVPVAADGPVPADATLTAFPVRSLLRVGPVTYGIGAGWVAAYRGSGLLLSPGDGRLQGAVGSDGQISDAVPDGRGGAYLGGQFTVAGGLRRTGVVRIDRDGVVDRAFRVRGLRFVNALALGGGRLYAGGSGGAGVVALDPRSGRRLAGFRAPAAGRVSELELDRGRLYVGGPIADRFEADRNGTTRPVRGPVRPPVAALDARTGRPLARFRPTAPATGAPGQVTALRMIHGRLWMATGSLQDRANGRLRLLDPATGRVRGAVAVRGTVLELVRDGGRVIAVGALRRPGGGRDLAQALDARTGARRSGFAVRAAGPREVATDALRDRGRLVLGGSGRRPPGPVVGLRSSPTTDAVTDTGFVSAVGLRTGAADRSLDAPVPDSDVHALVRTGRRLVVGGAFAAVDRRPTDLVALDAATGRPSPAPVPVVPGAQDAVVAGGLVWVSDGFDLLAFDPTDGRVRHRTPLPYVHERLDDAAAGTRANQRAVPIRLTAAGGRIFASQPGAEPSGGDRGVTAFDASTGRQVLFRLPLESAPLGEAPALQGAGDALYVAGSFLRRRPSGQLANMAVLKIDPRTGALDERFDAHVSGPASALGTEGPGGRLFVAGSFPVPGTDVPARPGSLIAVSPTTGVRDPGFVPRVVRSDPDRPIAVSAGAVVIGEESGRPTARAYDPTGRPLRGPVPARGFLSTFDGAGVVATGTGSLLGRDTPGAYGLVRRGTP